MQQGIFVALGSNLDGPAHQVRRALDQLEPLGLAQASPLYRSEPWGLQDQPHFVNAVVRLENGLPPLALLDELLALEARAGRTRDDQRWGPRVLDLDLLAYHQITRQGDRLDLPHPRLAERAFVLVPWARIAPDFEVPGLGRVDRLADDCPDTTAVRLLEP